MSPLGQKRKSSGGHVNVRSSGQSRRIRPETGHRHSKVRCWGQSGRTGDMALTSASSQLQTSPLPAPRREHKEAVAEVCFLGSARDHFSELHRPKLRMPHERTTSALQEPPHFGTSRCQWREPSSAVQAYIHSPALILNLANGVLALRLAFIF